VTERITPLGRWKGLDRVLLLATLLLVAVGLVLIYSADHAFEDSDHFEKQVFFAAIGTALMLAAAFIPTRYYFALAFIVYGIALLFLILVPIIGTTVLGAKRWITIAGVNLQPSEPAKAAYLIAASRFLSGVRSDQSELRAVFGVVLGAIGPLFLVVSQPDLGTSSLFPVIGAALLAWWGLPLWYYILAAMPFVALFFFALPWLVAPLLLAGFWWMYRAGMKWVGMGLLAAVCMTAIFSAPHAWSRLEPYQQRRLTTFLDPMKDQLGAGYQIIQSKVALGSGGFTGAGFLKGTQTQLRFLPQQHTDFIFSLAGEEFGILGTSTVLVLLIIYGWRGIRIASRARSQFAGLVAGGLTTMIVYHAVVNIGMTMGVLPVTGIPLPFISAGGSFLITCLFNTGLLLSIGIYRRE